MKTTFAYTPANSLMRYNESFCDSQNKNLNQLPEILFITSYPNRECGIATYSQDLVNALQAKFGLCYSITICALEANEKKYNYSPEVKYTLHTANLNEYRILAELINSNSQIKIVLVEHEFGLFGGTNGDYFLQLLALIRKPVITTFHTVLPEPDEARKKLVQTIAVLSKHIIVMTKNSDTILQTEYKIAGEKIILIPHGTHLAKSNTEQENKAYLRNKLVLSTFGLISSGKSIETALDALPSIIEKFPNILYLIIGKTHP